MNKPTKDFVKDQEKKSRKAIKDHYDSIDALCWEFDYLDNLLAQLKNRRALPKLSILERNEEMEEISERMTRILEDIDMYKECINSEKKEMKRIHCIWGYGYTDEDNTNSDESEYEQPYTEEDEESEEPVKIKYNQALDIFEDISKIPPPNSQLYYHYNKDTPQSNEVSTGGF